MIVVQALVEHFLGRRDEWDVFRWSGLRHPVETYGALCPPCIFMGQEGLPDFVLDLPKSWNDLRLQVSSNMRKNLRKACVFLNAMAFAIHVARDRAGQTASGRRWRGILRATRGARGRGRHDFLHPDKFAQAREARTFSGDYPGCGGGPRRTQDFRVGNRRRRGGKPELRFLIGSDLYFVLCWV